MAFPFVAPFDGWVQEVLKQREEDRLIGVYKNPYAVLTSAAKVVKSTPSTDKEKRAEEIKKILKGEIAQGDTEYSGCIIANNISNLELSYATGLTPVGIDFKGRVITVEGESDRRVSTPIIESIDIDTDGANNTLKTAQVKVKCFTLKQLEMFENFFMKPGMNVLLEFGDSSILAGLVNKIENGQVDNNELKVFRNGKYEPVSTITKVEEALIQKQDFESFSDEFTNYFKSSIDGTIKYFAKVENSLGTYDLIAGKVTDFNFSIEADLTYNVDLEITQANQISLALPNNPKKINSTANTTAKDKGQTYSEREQIIDSIVLNFDLEKSKLLTLLKKQHPRQGKDWISDEFFNYNKVDTEQKDQIASAKPYVSLRFVLNILMNYVLTSDGGNGVDDDFFEFLIPKHFTKKVNDQYQKEVDFIPVSSRKNIISISDSIIFPTKELPVIVFTGKDNLIDIDSSTRLDGRINGYNFHHDGDLYEAETKANIGNPTGDDRLGNALNIFISYEDVVRIWKQELYRIDFLEKILNLINKNSLGLFQLVYANVNDNGKGSIIDYKLCTYQKANIVPVRQRDSYRFKIGPEKSIVKNFSFNFELSNLVAGQTVFNNNKFVYEAIREKNKSTNQQSIPKVEEISLPPEVYKSIDMSTMGNADGWYAINYIELKTIQAKLEKTVNQLNNVNQTAQQQILSGSFDQTKEVTKEEVNVADIIKQTSTQFKFGNENKILIYKDEKFVLNKIQQTPQEKYKKPTLSPIDINLTVDGFSGFRCGYCFNIDGIPEIYNQNGVFQITNVKHSINNEGWTTTIEAGYLNRKFD
jgi:hypothetical protein